jgi:hypothetical protein
MGLKTAFFFGIIGVYLLLNPTNPDTSCVTYYNSTLPIPPDCTIGLMISPFTTPPFGTYLPILLMSISAFNVFRYFTDEVGWDSSAPVIDRDIARNEPWEEEPIIDDNYSLSPIRPPPD